MKENWTYKKVKEVCKKASSNIVLNKIEDNTGDYPLYGASGFVKGVDFYHRDEPYIGIVKDGSGVGRVDVYPAKSSLVGTMQYILPQKECSLKYLCYALQGLNLSQFVNGAAIPHIYFRDYGECTIPVPPIETQSCIVSELDLLQSIIDKQKAQVKELDNLAQAVFYDMFGDPVENEKGWEVKKLGEVCDEIGDGLHGTPQYDANGSFAFINGNNLIDGKIVITDKTQFVTDAEAEKIFIAMDANTVLVSINGTLGKTAIYNNERIVLGKSACYCKLNDVLMAKFVLPLMNTQEFQLFLENNSSKSTIKNVGLKAIRNYRIILPPLSLQQSFATKIESIEKQKAAINQSIAETQRLFDYTMDKYFG